MKDVFLFVGVAEVNPRLRELKVSLAASTVNVGVGEVAEVNPRLRELKVSLAASTVNVGVGEVAEVNPRLRELKETLTHASRPPG